MEAFGGVGCAVGLITNIAQLVQNLHDLRERYTYAALNISMAGNLLWSIRVALKAIEEWRTQPPTLLKIPNSSIMT